MVTVTIATGTLLCCATATALLLFLERPAATRETALAVVPWLVAATPLHALHGGLSYPPIVEPVFALPWIFLLLGTLCGGTWLLLTQLTVGDGTQRRVVRYLGLVGVGTTVAPFGVLVTIYGAGVPLERLLVWAITPALAFIVTYVVLLSLWILLPRTAAFAGFTGAFLLFGLALHAVVVALAAVYGTWIPSPLVVGVVESIAVALDVSETVALVWITIWSQLLLAVVVTAVFAALERWRTALGKRGFDAVTVVSVVGGSNTFVLALARAVIV